MALLKCQDCGRDVSDRAAACPACGCPVPMSIASPVSSVATPPPVPPAPLVMPPGTPTVFPAEPQVGGVVFGAGVALFALWLLFFALPAHSPMSTPEQLTFCAEVGPVQCAEHWMLAPGLYYALVALAILFAFAGVQHAVQAATYRPYTEVICKRCRVRVIGKKMRGGIACPLGPPPHYARPITWTYWVLGILVASFAFVAVGGIGVIVVVMIAAVVVALTKRARR